MSGKTLKKTLDTIHSAVSVACLTIYDMCKAADRGIITGIRLTEKAGGKNVTGRILLKKKVPYSCFADNITTEDIE